ncbi:hypothetical protein ABT093_36130 [Kitasatospora sp. NPDC002551]|uniref:NHL domain-containing protein n=1 Tax=Kitasatospora sp. NPDC002551 TaxID=3154539 RepID=UPI003331462F
MTSKRSRIVVLKNGYIDRIAGTGEEAHEFGQDTGDGHRALSARIGQCYALAVAGDGTVYLCQEEPDRVRKVDPQGIIHDFAGTGEKGYSGDKGPAVSARMHWPLGIVLDPKGNDLYIADSDNNCVRKVDSGGTITRYAGTAKAGSAGVPGPPDQAELVQPCGLAIDGAGNLFIADTRNLRILKVDPQGQRVTLYKKLSFQPLWLAVDGAGNLYVIDQEHQKTLSVISAKDQQITVIEDGSRGFYMMGLAADADGSLFVSYLGEGTERGIFMLSASERKFSTVAGFGQGSSGDGGPAVAAGLQLPVGLALNSTGDLYIWDTYTVRVIKKAREAAKVRPVVVSVSGPAPEPIPGGSTTKGPLFKWDVQRPDGGPLDGTTVTVTLPAEVEEVAFTPAGGTLDPGKKKITWTLTGKDTKQHFELTANVTPPDDATSVSVHVTAQHGDETIDDRDISIPVAPKEDPSHKPVLAIPTWKVFPAQAGRGSHVAFAWKIVNQGQATAKDVKAAVTLPKGLTPVGEYKDTAGVWDEGKRTVTSSQGGSLKAGAYWWITVVARVDDDAPTGDLEAKVVVSATGAASAGASARVTVKDSDKPLVWALDPKDVKGAFLGFSPLKDPDHPEKEFVGGIGGGPLGGIIPGTNVITVVKGILSLFSFLSITFSWLLSFTITLSFFGGFFAFGSDGGPQDTDPQQPEKQEPDEDEQKNKITRLWFTKAALAPEKPAPGQDVTLTWELKNTGKDDATSVTAQVRLPDTLDFTSVTTSTGSFSSAGGVLLGSLGTLKPGDTVTITVKAKVRTGAASAKDATATAAGGHATPARRSVNVPIAASGTVTLVPGQPLPQPAEPGKQVTFTWDVRPGTADATGVVATVTWPAAALDPSSVAVTVGSQKPAAKDGKATATIGTLKAADQPVRITLTGIIAPTQTKDLTATASVTATGMTTPDEKPVTATVQTPATSLNVWGAVLPGRVTAGYGATYVWALVNNGPTELKDATLTAQLPPAARASNARATRGGQVTAGQKVTWPASTIGTLKPQQHWIATVEVDLPGDITEPLPPVTAQATATGASNHTSAPVSAPVDPNAPASLTGITFPSRIAAAAPTTQTWTVTNAGPSTLTDAALKITVPKGLTPTALTVDGTARSTPAAGTETSVLLPSVPPKGRITVQLTAKADTGASGVLRTTAAVATRAVLGQPVVVGVLVTGSGGLTLTADPAGEIPLKAGADTAVTLIVSSNGTTDLEDARLVLTPPKGVTVRAIERDGVALDSIVENGAVVARLDTLGSGARVTLTAVVAAEGTMADGKATLAARVSADKSSASANATVTLAVSREALLFPKWSLSPNPPQPGKDHVFAWTVVNAGPSTSPPRSLTATADTGVKALTCDPPADINGQNITWTSLPALAPEQAWTLVVIATVDAATKKPGITLHYG